MALSEDYELHIRQGPERARVAGVKGKGVRGYHLLYLTSKIPNADGIRRPETS
jgi:hypothetical protein